ncbi:MAG: phosphoglycerate dehydrogenase, partial [Acidimicrobiia bacterium]|nr:phosphoglycerate dehydrogenase [Acidimicrobiia bacterium]
AMAERGITLLTPEEVVAAADIVTIHTPLAEETRGWFDKTMIDRMKDGAILVNTARGGIVDEVALFDALASGKLMGAALDVHQREGAGVIPKLAELSNVVLTPHIGGMALESQALIGERIEFLISAYLAGEFDASVLPEELLI